ncbi:heterokaryon incompatibility protein-domain-containing protein [Xylariales sp. PMI_506]|nr:heterokaryon incompatibility protein-domain-containing protein [Xylariales sp. PMI_506]
MSTIKCEIIHVSAETELEAKEYTAISYSWGDIDPNVMIQVDGFPFYITPSLHGALKTLRQQDKSVMLWADAICIDQRNKTEQSEQVAMMTQIYTRAESVAVWLGPEADNSDMAATLLETVARLSSSPDAIVELFASEKWKPHFTAVVNLFERDFWSRLWVVQEILNARSATVYCGSWNIPWAMLERTSEIFKEHEANLQHHFPRGKMKGSVQGLSYAHILSSQGPSSLNVLRPSHNFGPESLLEVLRICRTKLAAEPRDKVFGVLGILPEIVRFHFPPNYNASLREVYTNVVDLLLHTTRRLDVICDAIYFPIHSSTSRLPTWVPDWSHIPSTAGLGLTYGFSAAGDSEAEFDFLDPPHRTKLKISAVELDSIKVRGIAVGTFCTLDDYLMAFLHWRSKLLHSIPAGSVDEPHEKRQDEAFCRTLCLGDITGSKLPFDSWTETCYHVFASLIHERLPDITLDQQLQGYVDRPGHAGRIDRRMILQEHCASAMEGRCFFTTDNGLMGMGSGFMKVRDTICIPLGCRTPLLLRQEGPKGQYRVVGDAYVDGYMNGEVMEEFNNGNRKITSYILH